MRDLVDAGVFEVVPASDGSASSTSSPRKAMTCSPWWWRCGSGARRTSSDPANHTPSCSTAATERPLHTLEIRASDGRRLDPDNTVVNKVDQS